MKKVIILTNNTPLTSAFRMSANITNVQIVATWVGFEDLQRSLTAFDFDVLIAAEPFYMNDKLPEMVAYIESQGMKSKLICLISDPNLANYLTSKQVPYMYLNRTSAQDVLESLELNPGAVDYIKPQGNSVHAAEETNIQSMAQNLYQNVQQKESIRQMESGQTSTFGSPMGSMMNPFKRICVTINSPKGGVGKSTTAIEIGTMLAKRAQELDLNRTSSLEYTKKIEVCLIDLNPSFDTICATLNVLRGRQNKTIADLAAEIEKRVFDTLSDAQKKEVTSNNSKVSIADYFKPDMIHFDKNEIKSFLVQDPETGLYILPAVAVPFDVFMLKSHYIRFILNTLKQAFDIVVIDTGNNLNYYTTEAFHASDQVLLLTTPQISSSVVIGKLMANLSKIKEDSSKFALVINSPYGKNGYILDPQPIQENLKMPIASILPFDENVRIAHEKGVPFSINNRKTPYAKEIMKLSSSICPLWDVRRSAHKASGSKSKFGFEFLKK